MEGQIEVLKIMNIHARQMSSNLRELQREFPSFDSPALVKAHGHMLEVENILNELYKRKKG